MAPIHNVSNLKHNTYTTTNACLSIHFLPNPALWTNIKLRLMRLDIKLVHLSSILLYITLHL